MQVVDIRIVESAQRFALIVAPLTSSKNLSVKPNELVERRTIEYSVLIGVLNYRCTRRR